ncbi:PREDICTED: proprotein convertase subtilisin/kexin type 7-like [Amphimedon queenslandica]|uniref:P/Homo B domain-containing protein n=1 Tax=Amphimedon queenslandica TaxID=400682 RepID=A0A1X7SUB1_AMPQE|nr:PREDICTED: proprotein convertase subtilisin/kexin type 7-like [Amphimedon queenslandica]|eukprot:XP_011408814.2 PREDICTED: proprotein convertase subtilisin/kexin type 7-like [Amphimedon queenslandica]
MHSHQHGFGVLDAYRLTRSAQVWPLLPAQVVWKSDTYYANSPIPYSMDRKLQQNITLSLDDMPPSLHTLEHVAITVTIDHTYRGALILDLVSPSGTVSHLATSRKKDSSSKGLRDWTFTTVRCWGEGPLGVWSLQVADDTSIGIPPDTEGESRGYLLQWSIKLYGTNLTSLDIVNRKILIDQVVNGDDDVIPSTCPPKPTNLQDITFPDSPIGNKLLKVLSALAAVIVSILFLHILITFIYRKMRDKKNSYRSALPPVTLRHLSSTAEEEEGLLLESRDNNENEWNEEIVEDKTTL